MAPQHENEDFRLCGQYLNVQIEEDTREQIIDDDFMSTKKLCSDKSIPSLYEESSSSSGTFETIQMSYSKARASNDDVTSDQSYELSTLPNSVISISRDDDSDVSDLYYIGSDLQYTYTPEDLSFTLPEPKLCLCEMLDHVKILIFGFDDDLDC